MAWDHLDITRPHLVYIILGGFTSLFMLCSSFIKERMYIGEATVATLCGVIFGPHAANLINPNEWGSTDIVTLEFSRIVLVVQCFAVGVELPKFYMEKHWRSVIFLLVPVMTFGWLIVSLFIWWMIPPLDWLQSLVVAACVTATDPVLASSVVGKGKFAKRVPKHLRDLLSAESGCNDGMAFPFIYLSLYLIQYNREAGKVSFHFVVYVILYECVFGAIYGFMVGYIARHGIRLAEERDLIDRESFLVFYFVVALFCAGSGSILGLDDLLVGFAAGVGFSNDGWFGEKTEESHVSNVIDLLLNLTYFVYFGTIIPWEQFNNGVFGLKAWRLVVISIMVLLFRRIPVMLALKPLIPDVKTWREALFAGHFGPIGVGAIFVAILARAELEHEEPVPLSEMPPEGSPHYDLIYLVWPIVCFMVVVSILVHGSSIAVFTLGKRINTLTLTMSYTAAPEDGPSWMNRLPRISSQSRSQAKPISDGSDDNRMPDYPPGTLAPPTGFLRRQRDEDSSRPGSRTASLVSRKRKSKKWDDEIGPGGPISQSAIFPSRSSTGPLSPSELNEKDASPSARDHTDSTLVTDSSGEKHEKDSEENERGRRPAPDSRQSVDMYEEGHEVVFENRDGDVIDVQSSNPNEGRGHGSLPAPVTSGKAKGESEPWDWTFGGLKKRMGAMYEGEMEKRKDRNKGERRHAPARAYQFGNTIIVEDEDGEVVKTYELPSQKAQPGEGSAFGKYVGFGGRKTSEATPGDAHQQSEPSTTAGGEAAPPSRAGWSHLGGILGSGSGAQRKEARQKTEQEQAEDDKKIRFTIGGVGQRMTKEDFLREVQKLDSRTRKEVVDQSTAPQNLKRIAKQDIPSVQLERTTSAQTPETSSSGASVSGGSKDLISAAPVATKEQVAEDGGETAVERKRRLAVLSTQADETTETPAERRRREAALGTGNADDSSDDEGDSRVPPEKRGIRFAEPTRRQ